MSCQYVGANLRVRPPVWANSVRPFVKHICLIYFCQVVCADSVRPFVKHICLTYFLLCLISCAVNEFASFRAISSLVLVDSLAINTHVDKVCYSPIDKTLYLLNINDNSVRIYKNGTLHNTIGRSGFADDNFRKLSDINVGVDSYLYTLDVFDKSLKRFDSDGKYIGQVSLHSIASPEKFAFSQHGNLFIYDSHSKEIMNLDTFNFAINYTFGKFQINRADEFFILDDYIYVYDKDSDEADIFWLNGMYVGSYQWSVVSSQLSVGQAYMLDNFPFQTRQALSGAGDEDIAPTELVTARVTPTGRTESAPTERVTARVTPTGRTESAPTDTDHRQLTTKRFFIDRNHLIVTTDYMIKVYRIIYDTK